MRSSILASCPGGAAGSHELRPMLPRPPSAARRLELDAARFPTDDAVAEQTGSREREESQTS